MTVAVLQGSKQQCDTKITKTTNASIAIDARCGSLENLSLRVGHETFEIPGHLWELNIPRLNLI